MRFCGWVGLFEIFAKWLISRLQCCIGEVGEFLFELRDSCVGEGSVFDVCIFFIVLHSCVLFVL